MKDKLKYYILILSSPLILIFILGPLETYKANFTELKLDFSDFFYGFMGGIIIVLIIAALILAFIPEKISQIICTLIFAGTIASYVQANFLNRNLITSDGSSMDWSGYGAINIANGVFWIEIFIVSVIFCIKYKKSWMKAMKYTCMVLSIIMSITAVTLIVSSPKKYDNGYQLDDSQQFVLGKEKNIIVIVLDRYGNEQFEKVRANYSEITDCLKDFTYYNNVDSRYSNTNPSMPHIMTGQQKDYSMEADEWLASIWKADSTKAYYDTIHNDGYEVHLYSPYASTCYGPIVNMKDMIDNVETAEVTKDYRLIYALMTKSSLYKYAPYVLKPRLEVKSYIYNQMVVLNEPEFLNSEFYSKLKEEGLRASDEMDKCIVVDHILGLHNPFEIDEYGNKTEDLPETEENIDNVTRGVHVILAEYLNQLKEVGLYDSSTIIITADHGDYVNGGGLQPVYFIKNEGETHDGLMESSAPLSHDDFVPTILYLLGEDYSEYGTCIYDWKEGDRRARMIDDHQDSTYYTDRYELYRMRDEKHISF